MFYLGWGCQGYINGPGKNAFIIVMGEANEVFASGSREGGKKHVE